MTAYERAGLSLGAGPPTVSVVIPARNEGSSIDACLSSILDQEYPPERMEILVVDGRSTDDTRERILGRRDVRLRLIDNPERTVPHGMNLAIERSRGEILVRVDAHTRIAADYVAAAVDLLVRSGAWGVGGPMTAVGETRFGKAVALATAMPFGIGDSAFHYAKQETEAESVYMGVYRVAHLRALGGYDRELTRNQDDELNARIRARGGRLVLSPRLRSEYTCRGTPRSLARQYFQYGSWKVLSLRKTPAGFRPRHLVPPLFVAALLTGPVLSAAFPVLFGTLFCVGLGLYGAALALAAVRIRKQAQDPGVAVRCLLVFPLLHVAYGAGVWHGLKRLRSGAREAIPDSGGRRAA